MKEREKDYHREKNSNNWREINLMRLSVILKQSKSSDSSTETVLSESDDDYLVLLIDWTTIGKETIAFHYY